MDASTRRKYLAVAVIVGFASATFLGGGYAFGWVTDQESSEVSVGAASDFDDSSPPAAGDNDVTFSGCGEAWFRPSNGESFAVTLALYNSSRNATESVSLTETDAGSAATGFRYDPDRERYKFDVHEYYGSTDGEDKIFDARLDGERFENDNRCAENVGDDAETDGEVRAAGTATPTETTERTTETEDATTENTTETTVDATSTATEATTDTETTTEETSTTVTTTTTETTTD